MPPLDGDHPVTILGAGLVGICTGLSLLEQGVSVRLIDRGDPGQETSSGNAGIISPWSIVPQAMPGTWKQIPSLMFGEHRPLSIRAATWPAMLSWGMQFLHNGREGKVRAASKQMRYLCEPSIELYRRHLTGTGHEDLVRDSYYVHAFRKGQTAKIDALDYRIRREAGATIEQIGAEELATLEPALAPIYGTAILIKDQARAVSPGKIGEVLAAKFARNGGELVKDEIRSLNRTDNQWSIEGASRNYLADKVVLALGAWSAGILRSLGIHVPMMAERGYHIEFPASGVELNNSVMDVASKVVASTMEGGLRVAGQAEFAPVDAPPDPAISHRIEGIARTMIPGLKGSEGKSWMGRRPSLPDNLPAIGEVPRHPGLICNFGHSHYGLMMAPKSGEVVAGIVTQRPTNYDITALSPTRFI